MCSCCEMEGGGGERRGRERGEGRGDEEEEGGGERMIEGIGTVIAQGKTRSGAVTNRLGGNG